MTNTQQYVIFISPFRFDHSMTGVNMMMAHSSQTRIVGKDKGSILACSLVAVETDSLCAPPTALWTDEGLG